MKEVNGNGLENKSSCFLVPNFSRKVGLVIGEETSLDISLPDIKTLILPQIFF